MTDKYAVIGNPVAHSKSPQIHAMFARQTRQDLSYEAILAPLDGFSATIERLRRDGYKGCNVTVPFKFEAYNLVEALENSESRQGICNEAARTARAANTLAFRDCFVYANNTDGTGLVNDIQSNLQRPLQDRRILLMGAGGASYGVLQPLLKEEPKRLHIANRTPEKAKELRDRCAHVSAIEIGASSYAEIDEEFDVIINATSSGLSDELPPLPPGIFARDALAYDMMYGRETPFMTFARKHGAALVSDGLGMLVEQAAESFRIWRNVRPDTSTVIASLR
jgi:shikimate dehydrogenase